MAKLLAFNIKGDYAHFKKFYTTTSPLTFEFPPPPTLMGTISAIIGLDKNEYLSFFQDEKDYNLGVCLENPVKKVRWTQNLVDTKKHFWKIQNRTQIRVEFLKDPSYSIYFSHDDPAVYNRLKKRLENHESVYSICLGISELLANYEYYGEMEYEIKSTDDWISLGSVLPVSRLTDEESIDFSHKIELFKVNYPIKMGVDRVVGKREDVIFERNANPIRCKVKQYAETVKGDRIVFF